MRLPRFVLNIGPLRPFGGVTLETDLGTTLRRRIFSIPTFLSLGVAGAFIFFLASGIDLDWSETWLNVRNMKIWPYLLALALYYLSFLFRGYRWKLLARSAVDSNESENRSIQLPSILRFSQLIVMGWFINTIAWLRLGDAYRAWMFSEDSKSGFFWGVGTLLAERVLDMATVALLVVIAILIATATIDNIALDYLLIAAAAMAGLLVALLISMRVVGLRLAKLLPVTLSQIYGRFHQGTLGSIDLPQLPLLLLLSLIGWCLEAARLYFVVQALDLSLGIPMVMLVSLGHAVLSTVPTPGGVGAVEAGMTGLLVLSLPKADAASVAVLDRSITLLSVIVIGGVIFLLNEIMKKRALKATTGESMKTDDSATV